MEHHHSPRCIHCLIGCDHDHNEADPLDVGIAGPPFIPAIAHSVATASDDWRNTRCTGCGTPAKTPTDALPLLATPDGMLPRQDRDGYYRVTCGRCLARLLIEQRMMARHASRN